MKKCFVVLFIYGCILILLIGCNLGGVTPLYPQTTIYGHIEDLLTGLSIEGVFVVMDTVADTTNDCASDYTDIAGNYCITLCFRPFENPFSAFKSGYHPQTKYITYEHPQDSLNVDFKLQSIQQVAIP